MKKLVLVICLFGPTAFAGNGDAGVDKSDTKVECEKKSRCSINNRFGEAIFAVHYDGVRVSEWQYDAQEVFYQMKGMEQNGECD